MCARVWGAEAHDLLESYRTATRVISGPPTIHIIQRADIVARSTGGITELVAPVATPDLLPAAPPQPLPAAPPRPLPTAPPQLLPTAASQRTGRPTAAQVVREPTWRQRPLASMFMRRDKKDAAAKTPPAATDNATTASKATAAKARATAAKTPATTTNTNTTAAKIPSTSTSTAAKTPPIATTNTTTTAAKSRAAAAQAPATAAKSRATAGKTFIAATKARSPSGYWNCYACTFQNLGPDTSCAVCGVDKHDDEVQSGDVNTNPDTLAMRLQRAAAENQNVVDFVFGVSVVPGYKDFKIADLRDYVRAASNITPPGGHSQCTIVNCFNYKYPANYAMQGWCKSQFQCDANIIQKGYQDSNLVNCGQIAVAITEHTLGKYNGVYIPSRSPVAIVFKLLPLFTYTLCSTSSFPVSFLCRSSSFPVSFLCRSSSFPCVFPVS